MGNNQQGSKKENLVYIQQRITKPKRQAKFTLFKDGPSIMKGIGG
jgi:hypothetical protein